jgi:hypothetical protein
LREKVAPKEPDEGAPAAPGKAMLLAEPLIRLAA